VRVLVTGGAGFIGSNLVRCLVASHDEVRILDDLSTGSRENLADCNGAPELIVGDVRDPEAILGAVQGVEVVYHLAALPSVARSVADPLSSHQVNVNGTLNVLIAARDAGVSRVVYASSSSVYGDTPTLPKHEDMPPAPRSPYASAKLSGELYCRAFSASYGLETVSLRFFNVFGPRQDPASEYAAVVPQFITRMLSGRPPVIFGDGQQSRDYTYVANVIQACILAATAGDQAVGEAMNTGCEGRTSLVELVATLNELLGTRIEPVFSAPRQGDVRHSQASVTRAGRLLGYRPLVNLRDGLSRTIEWFADSERKAPEPAGARLGASRFSTQVNEEGINGVA
jgi:nucleoside-diphosphate-sugar epimerase